VRLSLRLGVAVALATLLLCGVAVTATGREQVLRDSFSRGRGPSQLITNEYAFYNPGNRLSARSSRWQMTSGSLFSRNGVGWSGPPDLTAPNARSSNGTGSGVFRMRTRRRGFRNVLFQVDIRVLRWLDLRPGQVPGVALWTRYVTPRLLYWLPVLAEDGKLSIEKKVPGGPYPANGGTYYALPPYTSPRHWPVTLGRWYRLKVIVRTRRGRVSIATYRDGQRVQSAIDRGRGQTVQESQTGNLVPNPAPPIAGRARLGVRADNAEFEMRRLRVYRLR
jgi:hypothetical protein